MARHHNGQHIEVEPERRVRVAKERSMHIGVAVTERYQMTEVMQIAQRAEALGFDSLWVPEHPIIPVHIPTPFPNSPDGRVPEAYAHWPDPFVTLTAVATVTSRLKLATGICLVPEREPLVTAKVVASLDVLSHGRVLLGVGGGALREETEILGTPFGRRWQRLREHVEAMKALWTQEEASYQGEFVRFPAVKSYPKPSQQPHPPVLLGAQRGPRVLARVARYCEGWMPFGIAPDEAREAITRIHHLARDAGRRLEMLDVTVITTPDGLTRELLRRYQDAGVHRLVLPLRAGAGAGVTSLDHLAHLAPVVEQAQQG